MNQLSCTVLVVGAGPGGYTAAIRSGQLGLKTIVVENAKAGGTCLNIGCIPSKALIHAADLYSKVLESASEKTKFGIHSENPRIELAETIRWKDQIVHRLSSGIEGLLEKAGVQRVQGWARFIDGKTVVVETPDSGPPMEIRAEYIILATGSRPVELRDLPFGGKVISSTEALSLTSLPEKLVVVGGGYIGLELGSAYQKFGSKVTIVEATDQILPNFDAELVRPISRRLKQLGVTVLTGAMAIGMAEDSKGVMIKTADNSISELPADQVVVTVGRAPVVDGWGLEELDLDRNGSAVSVDSGCRTSMAGVFAVGDLTGEPMLAHRAMAQGSLVAEIIAGKRRRWDKVAIPAVVYSDPEIVTVGLSPDQARQEGFEVIEGRFPYSASGRALTMSDTDGFIRVVARADNHLVLGIQGVGADISELSSAFTLALEMAARLEDIGETIHAHPTRSEALQEASLHALGMAIHI